MKKKRFFSPSFFVWILHLNNRTLAEFIRRYRCVKKNKQTIKVLPAYQKQHPRLWGNIIQNDSPVCSRLMAPPANPRWRLFMLFLARQKSLLIIIIIIIIHLVYFRRCHNIKRRRVLCAAASFLSLQATNQMGVVKTLRPPENTSQTNNNKMKTKPKKPR